MGNIEYEHSFKVKSIKPYIEYCEENGFEKTSESVQNRIVYHSSDNEKIIARVTIEKTGDKESVLFDCKNFEKREGDVTIAHESIPLVVTEKNRESILSILDVLGFYENANNLRTRYVYEKDDVKFEIDDYTRPEMKVVAIEGEKDKVDKICQELVGKEKQV